MIILKILYNWYSLNHSAYIRAFKYTCKRLDSYRLSHIVLLTLASHKGLINADMRRLYGGSVYTYDNVLEKLVSHGYVRFEIKKHNSNLINGYQKCKHYYITVEGKQVLNAMAEEMQNVFDKLTTPHKFPIV